MPVFTYKALDSNSAGASGQVTAETIRQARDQLRDRGLSITHISQTQQEAGQGRANRRLQRTAVTFIRELATLLRAGIPLLAALRTLQRQHKGAFAEVIGRLADHIAAGESLADAMARQPSCFDELCVSIVRVGENTGSLDAALRRLADFKEKALRLRSRIGTALLYPAIVGLVGVLAAVFLMTFVVPNLLETLIQADKPLPLVTRVVKAGSDFLLHWWWLLLGVLAVGVPAARLALAREAGKAKLDRFVLRVPVLGDLVRKENTLRLAVVMAALLRSGLPFVQALQVTRRTLANRVFRDCLQTYEAAVAAGADVAKPLENAGVFSPMVVQMLAVGQETGAMEEMLEQLAESHNQEIETATARLTALLEPLLIVLLAILVGFIAFATILPILEAGNVL